MNIQKGASGGSIPGRTPLYSCHIPFFFGGGRIGFHVFVCHSNHSTCQRQFRVPVRTISASTSPGEFTVPERSKKRMVTPARQGKCRFQFLSQNAGKNRIHLLARPVELSAQHTPEMHVFFNVSHFLVPHGTDAVLWIITIHHKYVISVQTMEITGEQHGKRGFFHTTFWVAQSDK